jgi:hypothetical protein
LRSVKERRWSADPRRVDRWLLLWLACLPALAVAAPADIYRCEEPDGSVRFADDPGRCPGAQPRRLGPREQESGTPAPPAGSGQGEAGLRPEELPAPELRLAEILLPAAGVAGGWEVVDEAPTDPARDPDLLRWGVRAQRTRHYTRSDDGGVQVCSIEIWSFENTRRARLAHENFRHPGWHFERQEHLLIMLRAVTLLREGPSRTGLFADCRRLGALTSARAATRLRR